ncbi:unnamed protein product [Polarella glacialis]|uniref:EF-hand domain-containing protein n=1 Tax=Polarella glacialis TaxID=89957 RepID=A0A813F5E1_POLGL|nr:unnamed protein product [Polarella glacialis]
MIRVKFAAGGMLLVALHTLRGVAKDVSCDTTGSCSVNDDDEASLVALRARGSRQPKLGFDEKVQEIFRQLDTNEDGALQPDEALEAGLQLIRGSAPTSVLGSIPHKNDLRALLGDSVLGDLNLDDFMQAAELARSSGELDRILWWKKTTTSSRTSTSTSRSTSTSTSTTTTTSTSTSTSASSTSTSTFGSTSTSTSTTTTTSTSTSTSTSSPGVCKKYGDKCIYDKSGTLEKDECCHDEKLYCVSGRKDHHYCDFAR